ncbi:MAG: hypothetical protein HYV60_24670, partial [Planctomycetia bacterium]|nr:hypothetical protein [Planctomycetia bacterium]
TVIEGNPTPHAAWQGLLTALLQPLDGQPQRPARIEVPQPEYRRVWGRLLDQLEIDCQMKYQPQPVSRLLEGMAGAVEAQRVTGLDEEFDARDLPQRDSVWQVDFFHQPTVLTNAKVGTVRPWSVLVMDKATRQTLINETFVDQPGAEQLWECAARVMQKTSQRPRRIEVSDADGFDVLRPELERADVECVMLDELPELHAFCLYMAASYGGPEKCALADGRDVDRDGMDAFYYAAAQYYRRKPWKYLSLDAPVEIDAAGGPTRYVQVLGRSGVTLGMTVYERQRDLVNMMHGAAGWDSISGCSVIFDEEAILAPADLYLVERHGWPIATPEAYPAAMRYRPGYEPGSPSASELTFLTACLHCLPDFVACDAEEKTYRRSDSGPPLEMRLRWSPGFATPSQRSARPLAEPLTKGNA